VAQQEGEISDDVGRGRVSRWVGEEVEQSQRLMDLSELATGTDANHSPFTHCAKKESMIS
jgi:hypothetical protein